ncbi:hypothetical protein H4W00_001641 [Psychrobacter sp. PL19]|uniref:hypothetical protein n=1 Tax=Psychrobacter sp. PL19 TaxID=2760711 RepID=UPI001AEB55C3
MPSMMQSYLPRQTPKTQTSTVNSKKWIRASLMFTIVASVFLTTGCSTTHEFKPTATVLVGAHKSL